MLHIPVLRWGQPYTSMDVDEVVHFADGEPIAKVSRANGGLIQRDMRKASRARDVLREIPIDDLIARVGAAGELYLSSTLPIGDGTQTPDEFVRAQSASTGLPERMCRANMKKNGFVLSEMRTILTSLTRGLDFDVLSRGHGEERGVPISYQAQSPVVGLVLPSNSPGVHTLWLPVIPMQIGLVLKPGPQEPWTPYRMAEAFFQAGIPREAISIYPGLGDVGAAVLDSCGRNLIFGGTATVDRYRGNPGVQAHGPGFSKILLGDDQVDRWEQFLDVMVDSVFVNSGRSCINCSGIWASRHTREIAEALAQKLAAVGPLPPDHPDASLAAFTVAGTADAISQAIDADLKAPGVTDVTAAHRDGPRVVKQGRADYLLPTVVHCDSPDQPIAGKEYMFPFVTVVECPEARMLDAIGPTLVCSAITCKPDFRRRLIDAVHIDRLNLGPVPTIQLNWLQPHEGNIIDFLFRARAFQSRGTLVPDATNHHEGHEGHKGQLRVSCFRGVLSCTVCLSALTPERHEDPLDHRRRRGHVLRQLLARQRAGGRAPGARPRRDAAPALHADHDRRGQRQPRSGALRRDQHLPPAASRAVPEDPAVPRSAVGLATRHRGVRQPVDLDRSQAARQPDDLDAPGPARRAPQGIRQAARMAGGGAGAGRHQSAELPADRAGGAAARRVEAPGLLHAAGRGSLSRRADRAVSPRRRST